MKTAMAVAITLACSALRAQTTPPRLSFEVASIHPGEPDQREASMHTDPGVFSVHNVTLRSCVEWAYGIKPRQLTGPGWLADERFDIVAHAEDRTADDDQLRLMVQALLADRFR